MLTGRDWSESDEFTFTIVPQDGAPAPEKTKATVKKADAKAGNPVPVSYTHLAVSVSGTVSGKRFYNDYAASLRHNAAGGIVTTKTLTCRLYTSRCV